LLKTNTEQPLSGKEKRTTFNNSTPTESGLAHEFTEQLRRLHFALPNLTAQKNSKQWNATKIISADFHSAQHL
tara:strand:- start:1048 stop:1266 length:219 start_codon:yes stop_codon:yes gene_type:complete